MKKKPPVRLDDEDKMMLETIQDMRASAEKGNPAQGQFSKHYTALSKLFGANSGVDLKLDSSRETLIRATLASVISLIPIAEAKYVEGKTESAAYAFNALVNQAKDLSAELQSIHGMDGQAGHIADNIVGEMTKSMLQNLISQFSLLRNDSAFQEKTARILSRKLDNILRDYSTFLDESKTQATEQIYNYLVGPAVPSGFKPKKKTTRHE